MHTQLSARIVSRTSASYAPYIFTLHILTSHLYEHKARQHVQHDTSHYYQGRLHTAPVCALRHTAAHESDFARHTWSRLRVVNSCHATAQQIRGWTQVGALVGSQPHACLGGWTVCIVSRFCGVTSGLTHVSAITSDPMRHRVSESTVQPRCDHGLT